MEIENGMESKAEAKKEIKRKQRIEKDIYNREREKKKMLHCRIE